MAKGKKRVMERRTVLNMERHKKAFSAVSTCVKLKRKKRTDEQIQYLPSEAKHKEGTQKNEPGSREEEAEVEGTIVGRVSDHPDFLLPRLMDEVGKRLLPGVHLDHFHPVDDLVHEPDAPIGLARSPHPQLSKLFSHPGLKGHCHHQQHNPLVGKVRYLISVGGTKPTTRELGPIL